MHSDNKCQILGLVARIRNNEVHNDNEAQKMTMELMIDCLATLRDPVVMCGVGVQVGYSLNS